MTDNLPTTTQPTDEKRQLALLRAIGLDRAAPEQREIALHIANRYDLDLLLKHLVLIEGRPYITRDGLLWVAHRSGQLDGIEVTEPEIVTLPGVGEFWRAVCSVYRKDMSRPFTYAGRYPTGGKNRTYGPEMAVKVSEVMALRRAFNVSAPVIEERWELSTVQADVDAVSTPQQPPRTLAERVAERRPTSPETLIEAAEHAEKGASLLRQAAAIPIPEEESSDLVEGIEDDLECGAEDTSPMRLGVCELPPGHKGAHRSEDGTWPQ